MVRGEVGCVLLVGLLLTGQQGVYRRLELISSLEEVEFEDKDVTQESAA
jgi:hypothetical protein